ncbi:hypothetical protein NDU88_000690 [Pleurodeles waltl]|uniref:Uncharacterized protein n=1 Tax=Pleurodeles waltl TaxID=8319 RepID=A0AAV7R4X0_PLEWA|nr:hypothetical protein NDU88_000690 [Pleurodeles waltl]
MESAGEAQGSGGKDEETGEDMRLVGPVELSVAKASCSRQETGAHGRNVGTKMKQVGGDTSWSRGEAVAQVEYHRAPGKRARLRAYVVKRWLSWRPGSESRAVEDTEALWKGCAGPENRRRSRRCKSRR